MSTPEHQMHAASLSDYLEALRRRKWLALTVAVLVTAAALAISLHQQSLYRASSQVLLGSQDLAATLTGAAQTPETPSVRVTATQAALARTPELAQRVLAEVPGTGLTPQGLLSASSVETSPNTDLLTFSVTDPNPNVAARLVNAYTRTYTAYRRELDTSSIKTALAAVERRLADLVDSHRTKGPLYASLSDRRQALQAMEALQTANASVVRAAFSASKTQPKTTRNVLLGLALGLVLGVALAFLREALDTRVRSTQEVVDNLGGVPLLTQVPAPSKRLRADNDLVMLADPHGVQAETFRMLRTNLEFVTLDRDVRTIMITSAVAQEGKSTTISNLAVALARAGKRVALVDLDLRRPALDRLFDLGWPGVTQVALGRATLDEALAHISIFEARGHHGTERLNGDGDVYDDPMTQVEGSLEVLPSGPPPPNPGEFIASHSLAEILANLRQRADVVLVDTPPVLQVGDAMALSRKVDGIIVVARLKVLRRKTLDELGRQLAATPTPVLGLVATDTGEAAGYEYGYGYAYEGRAQEAEAPQRSRNLV